MFSKFHHQQPPPPPPHFAVADLHHRNASDEADSCTPTTINDGASIEVVRRPRGRPPGSKNKLKPPTFVTREPDPSMSPYVLELAGGSDIVDAVTKFCRKRNIGLSVLSGSGTVVNVSLRQPSTAPSATVTFHGRFDILSISATVAPPSSAVAPFTNGFVITLAGPKGQIAGGAVAGPLVAGGTVYIVATSFNNPLYHRLPMEEDQVGGGSAGSDQSQPARSGGGDSGGHHAPPSTAAVETVSMYSSQLPSNVIWAPTPRQAFPHPLVYH